MALPKGWRGWESLCLIMSVPLPSFCSNCLTAPLQMSLFAMSYRIYNYITLIFWRFVNVSCISVCCKIDLYDKIVWPLMWSIRSTDSLSFHARQFCVMPTNPILLQKNLSKLYSFHLICWLTLLHFYLIFKYKTMSVGVKAKTNRSNSHC